VVLSGLAGRTWPQLDGVPPLLVVPLGSVEQHGPHLPLAADGIVAEAVVRGVVARLVERGVTAVAAPPVWYGASGEHEDFPGTVSIGHDALRLLLVEYGRSACRWARGIAFVNGHGGNVAALADAAGLLRSEGRRVLWTACAPPPGGDAHAGRAETSLLLHVAPEHVHVDRAVPGVTTPLSELLPDLQARGVRAVSSTGVLGDPTGASAAEGRRLLDGMVDRVLRHLTTVDAGDGPLVAGDTHAEA
jgi:mycofactocin system creatininase family protein